MLPRHRTAALATLLLIVASCEPAHRFPAAPSPGPKTELKKDDNEPASLPAHYGWLESTPRPDVPLVFVGENSNDWEALKDLAYELPRFMASGAVLLAATGPLEAAGILRASVPGEAIKIKVPRGLPDPTPFIPAANRPTYGQWALGKKLFFDRRLLVLSSTATRSCADCHDPKQGFTSHVAVPASGNRNVPSLINAVYNRHQFWDGRATHLEEVLLRRLEDEQLPVKEPPDPHSPGHLHVFPGLVRRVGSKLDYLHAFERVFGRDPTADNIARALATYMRMLLSGDSVYDQAQKNKLMRGGQSLGAEDIEPALSAAALDRLPSTLPAKDAAEQIARGYGLFHGKARCYVCHSGKLFSDNGFHNIGVGESAGPVHPGKEPGRFGHMPYGLKDRSQIGAFKTPTLRNVQLTMPYMHDGSLPKLADVLDYYNKGPRPELNEYLDAELCSGPGQQRPLGLSDADLAALELFLRSLRGNDIPAILAEPQLK